MWSKLRGTFLQDVAIVNRGNTCWTAPYTDQIITRNQLHKSFPARSPCIWPVLPESRTSAVDRPQEKADKTCSEYVNFLQLHHQHHGREMYRVLGNKNRRNLLSKYRHSLDDEWANYCFEPYISRTWFLSFFRDKRLSWTTAPEKNVVKYLCFLWALQDGIFTASNIGCSSELIRSRSLNAWSHNFSIVSQFLTEVYICCHKNKLTVFTLNMNIPSPSSMGFSISMPSFRKQSALVPIE